MYSNRNFGLDVIRSIAISFVVFSHCTFFFVQESENIIIISLRALGAIGVDLFFVLSGYLIGGILLTNIEDGKTSFSNLLLFWKRRWLRTLPNYFLVLVINILLALALGTNLPDNIFSYFFFIQNLYSPHPEFFSEAWSLSIEEFAYLFLPLAFYMGFLIFKNKNKKMFLEVTLFIITILYLVKVIYFLNSSVESYKEWSLGFRKVVIYRLDSIYFGFILVYLIKTFWKYFEKIKNSLLYLSLILFLITHYLIFTYKVLPQENLMFYVFFYLLIVGLCCGLIFPFFIHLKKSSNQFILKLIYFISTRSYAIYLLNYSIVLLNLQRIKSYHDFSLLGRTLIMLCFLGLTTLLSQIIYKLFEKPIMDLRPKL